MVKRGSYDSLLITALFVFMYFTTYYVYKGLEYSIRERVLLSETKPYVPKTSRETQTTETLCENHDRKFEVLRPSAPPANVTTYGLYYNPDNWQTYDVPPPSYNEVIVNENDTNVLLTNPNDLEWFQVFDAFNEKRMAMAIHWTPVPVAGRPLEKCLENVDGFLNAESHPVSADSVYNFLKSFVALTNLVYVESPVRRRINVTDAIPDIEGESTPQSHRERFLSSFKLIMDEYVPKTLITDKKVPFGYDWFIFSGRMTYAIVNAHIALCATDPTARPYYIQNDHVNTRAVVRGLKNICGNFTESLGYERYSSNRVYIGTAFLYASLLDRVCVRLEESRDGSPDYMETLGEILSEPNNRYDTFKSLTDEIGKTRVSPTDKTYDGVYDDRSFFAHRRLRMYAYIHPYCEQIPSVQLLLREKHLSDEKLAVLLRTVEPMSDPGALFYFNLHSRSGGFKYRNGSSLFGALGLAEFTRSYGRLYVADKARILFVQSVAFTFHAIGQTSDLAFGEVETSNRDLMPAWLMGQRPLFRSEKKSLVDVPCGAHLEPCVIDTGKSKGLKMKLLKRRNTTDYTPSEASSALVAFEEQNIGVVFTSVREKYMDVHYSRCTVATPYYTFTTYFLIKRNNSDDDDVGKIRLSCYTGGIDKSSEHKETESSMTEFKHCTVQLFVHSPDGKDMLESVVIEKRTNVEKRRKSKSKYKSDELKNVSLWVAPYGDSSHPNSPGSITILYRPKKNSLLPNSLATREISPRVTVEEGSVYRIQVDSRYVVYCDTVRSVTILLDVIEKRACISPIRSNLHEDDVNVEDLMERATVTVKNEVLGTISLDSTHNTRVYVYFQ